MTIFIYISNMKDLFNIRFIFRKVVLNILWCIVVVWNKWPQKFMIWHFKVAIITVTWCEMSENFLWGSKESNPVVFISSIVLSNWCFSTFVNLLVVIVNEEAEAHQWEEHINEICTLWSWSFLLLLESGNFSNACKWSVHWNLHKSLLGNSELSLRHNSCSSLGSHEGAPWVSLHLWQHVTFLIYLF